MPSEKSGHFRRPSSPPIPTYEEATSSNPETERLLGAELSTSTGASRRRHGYYQAPSFQSARSSEDSTTLPAPDSFSIDSEDEETHSESSADSDEGLRREVEQMDVIDPVDLEEGYRIPRSGWKGRMLALKRRIGRWKKVWAWRRPVWVEHIHFPWPSWPERWKQYTPGFPVIARLMGLFLLITLGYAFFVFEVMPARRDQMGQMFDPEGVRIFAQEAVDGERIKEYLRRVTEYSHTAGTEGSELLAAKLREYMWSAGLDDVKVDTYVWWLISMWDNTDSRSYWVYLNWPTPDGRRVAIIDPPELAFEANLDEQSPYQTLDPMRANSLVFHGHSKSGNITGPLIYANYGSRANYKQLYDSGVDISGTIALVRYGGDETDRALKIKAAEEWGVLGVLMYSDPAEDGFLKGETWPKGRYRPEDSVERGSVSVMSRVIGDVLTPGWASTEAAPRAAVENNPGLVNIPSLPLSWKDAQPLLKALKGHGQKLNPDTNGQDWIGGVPDVEWWTGDKTSPIVHLKNEQKENDKERILNVMGTIRGQIETEKKVIVGNHRDSWCFGAADPGSGTAVMLEVIGILGQLRAQGWRPVRTIEFASWDGEEYNLIGSTEYVEDHIEELRKNAVAYLNVDVGVTGSKFRAAASPLYKTALLRVLNRVSDPSNNGTIKQIWEENHQQLAGLGTGSDYVAFQDIAGTSSIDFGFEGEPYPYHSCYETFEWMETYGDPNFSYHKVLAQIWVLLILELSQEPILPFRLDDYANSVLGYIADLSDYAEKMGLQTDGPFDVAPLYEAAHLMKENAKTFHAWEDWWYGQVYGRGGFETTHLEAQRVQHNNRISDFETDLLDIPRSDDDKGPFGVSILCFTQLKFDADGLSSFPAASNSNMSFLGRSFGLDMMRRTSLLFARRLMIKTGQRHRSSLSRSRGL
jgi:N-acetylated-alpha-linked acidic dipeptidase